MLTIDDLTYRIEGRALFEGASAFIAAGWKVGVVGRNGSGKSTLMRLIVEGATGEIRLQRGARIGTVAQEIPQSDRPLIEEVLSADQERAALLIEAETAVDPMRIAEIHQRLDDIDAHSAEARAASVLVGLGFTQADLNRPCRAFSGGWRMRAALGGVLFSTPDLLILDEPTNYLDLEGAAWLEAHLRRYPNTVLVVSHDRSLLNQAVTHILALDQKKLSVHAGGYDLYQARRAEQIAGRTAQAKKQDEARARIQSFVDRFRAKASKARQAQSRIKALERMQTIEIPLEERTIPFRFEDPPEAAAPLLELDECDLGYVRDKPILRNVSLRIDPDDRVAIVGANGQGKSTLVKTIAARLSLMKGERRAAKGLVIGYFSQDQLDELRPDATPLEHVRDAAPANASQAAIRSIAAQIGFGAEKVQTPASSLSGGEKVRLLLGLIALKKPHLLILDEPTSHLDIDSREALIHALNDYNGAVLLITHDVFLAEAAAERIWLVNGGQAAPYQGDLAEYRALVLSSERATAKAEKATPSRPKPVQSAPSSSTLKRRIEAVERALADAHAEVRKLELILAAPGAFEDGGKGADAAARRATAEAQVSALEEEWLELSSTLEATKR